MALKVLNKFSIGSLLFLTIAAGPLLQAKSKKSDKKTDAKIENNSALGDEKSSEENEIPDKKFPAEIKHCHDGDTCRVVAENGMWFNARLAGIDAPEVSRYGKRESSGQPLGDQSQETLTNLVVKKKGIMLRQVDLDPYNRAVVEIYLNEECINLKMLTDGMAERYQGKTKRIDKAKYEEAESKGKSAKAGIWGLKDYVSPKLWRKEDKK